MKTQLITAAMILLAGPPIAMATEPQPAADPAGKALLLSAVRDKQAGVAVTINVVDRAKIDKELYVDFIGLRLWMDGGESLKLMRVHVAAAALGVKRQVAQKLMEMGVEPEMIPVRGVEGRKAGTEGMVLLKGGEFTRTGEFYDSSGGGLTILKDGTAKRPTAPSIACEYHRSTLTNTRSPTRTIASFLMTATPATGRRGTCGSPRLSRGKTEASSFRSTTCWRGILLC
jgi:hypothetical protein